MCAGMSTMARGPASEVPFPSGDPGLHLIHGMVAWGEFASHLDRLSCLCKADGCDQQTDTRTDYATMSVALEELHSRTVHMRPGLKNYRRESPDGICAVYTHFSFSAIFG